jgi:hypothetical protein
MPNFNIYLIVYIIIACFVTIRYTFSLYQSGEAVTAFFFFIGATTLFVLYGLRWFGKDQSMLSNSPVSWPPTMNTCPDYLTYYQLVENGAKYDMCIDMVGVSRNGGITKFPNSVSPPAHDNSCYFPLKTESDEPEKKRAELCQRAMAAGLTWEGITNGESCLTIDGQPSGAAGAAGAGTSGCPAK